MKIDVVVIGGGPAGTSASITLAKAGIGVALLERTAYDTQRVGEILPPEVAIPLQKLGVWERFHDLEKILSPGVVSQWGSSEPYENDFMYDPYGFGWHVNRNRFDLMLAAAAEEAGADIFMATHAHQCLRKREDHWIVEAEQSNRRLEFSAPFVIFAVGRARGPSCDGSLYSHYDRLIACLSYLRPRHLLGSFEPRTIIESTPNGWWYSAILPKNDLVIGFMTDSDLIPKTRNDFNSYLWKQLRDTTITRSWLECFVQSVPFQRFSARTQRVTGMSNRLSAGDAAIAFDPLSAQGVLNALYSGQEVAAAVISAINRDENAFKSYHQFLAREFSTYQANGLRYYKMEQRWPDSLFWCRRQNVVV